jgi:hypothetical protein
VAWGGESGNLVGADSQRHTVAQDAPDLQRRETVDHAGLRIVGRYRPAGELARLHRQRCDLCAGRRPERGKSADVIVVRVAGEQPFHVARVQSEAADIG